MEGYTSILPKAPGAPLAPLAERDDVRLPPDYARELEEEAWRMERKRRMILRRKMIFQTLKIAICRDWCTNFRWCCP